MIQSLMPTFTSIGINHKLLQHYIMSLLIITKEKWRCGGKGVMSPGGQSPLNQELISGVLHSLYLTVCGQRQTEKPQGDLGGLMTIHVIFSCFSGIIHVVHVIKNKHGFL